MSTDQYSSRRLNSLSRGPGPVESLLNAGWNLWCKLKGKSPSDAFETAAQNKPNSSTLPYHTEYVDTDIVCIHKMKKTLLDGFCEHNNIEPINLYLPVLVPDHVGVKRDVLNILLNDAKDISLEEEDGTPQSSYAKAVLSYFSFLSAYTGDHAPVKQPVPYKAATLMERHNQ